MIWGLFFRSSPRFPHPLPYPWQSSKASAATWLSMALALRSARIAWSCEGHPADAENSASSFEVIHCRMKHIHIWIVWMIGAFRFEVFTLVALTPWFEFFLLVSNCIHLSFRLWLPEIITNLSLCQTAIDRMSQNRNTPAESCRFTHNPGKLGMI